MHMHYLLYTSYLMITSMGPRVRVQLYSGHVQLQQLHPRLEIQCPFTKGQGQLTIDEVLPKKPSSASGGIHQCNSNILQSKYVPVIRLDQLAF
jgi:hypothetical protein